ncbi:hypothetical protein DH2020_043004 [Rehmannia glutinosa]|uniref:Uncharacterized protein n=1 Tax=Rehmannia glutinosa TaxID=99300 RepID=A0ABR0ULL4_REHGL
METHRVQTFEETCNNELMREALDELDEKRGKANLRMEVHRTLMKSAYDRQVRKWNFQVGDLLLRQANALKKRDKLESNWEGPYKVLKVIIGGAYELEDMEGHKVLRPWNVYVGEAGIDRRLRSRSRPHRGRQRRQLALEQSGDYGV